MQPVVSLCINHLVTSLVTSSTNDLELSLNRKLQSGTYLFQVWTHKHAVTELRLKWSEHLSRFVSHVHLASITIFGFDWCAGCGALC